MGDSASWVKLTTKDPLRTRKAALTMRANGATMMTLTWTTQTRMELARRRGSTLLASAKSTLACIAASDGIVRVPHLQTLPVFPTIETGRAAARDVTHPDRWPTNLIHPRRLPRQKVHLQQAIEESASHQETTHMLEIQLAVSMDIVENELWTWRAQLTQLVARVIGPVRRPPRWWDCFLLRNLK